MNDQTLLTTPTGTPNTNTPNTNQIETILTILSTSSTPDKYQVIPFLSYLQPIHIPTLVYSIYTMPCYTTCTDYILKVIDQLDTAMLLHLFHYLDTAEIENRFADKFYFLMLAVYERLRVCPEHERVLFELKNIEIKNYVLRRYLERDFNFVLVVDDMLSAPLGTLRVYEEMAHCFDAVSDELKEWLFVRGSERGIKHENRRTVYRVYERIRNCK
ncbi:hypothetical protein THOM_2937 [Trachipleistophora hominis]|uniref:Uncharacterized protein n=1 Tax=Trachipleistophora hominis TaxID=72359 RepID=L7JRT4_TRAHO|nr:hypothetical protein THOM_2937 [Trachipleistophora hominis]